MRMCREAAWYRHCGPAFERKCCARWCRNRITALDFRLLRGVPVCRTCHALATPADFPRRLRVNRMAGDKKTRAKATKKRFTKAEREQCWRHHFGKCYEHRCYVRWCRNRIDVYNFHMGHNKPESQGGSSDLRNLRPICANCNQGMGDRMTIDEWNAMHEKKQGWVGRVVSWVW